MAQSTILAVGDTRATSTSIVVAAGAAVSVGIFATTGNVASNAVAHVVMLTPGAAGRKLVDLTNITPAVSLAGPGTFQVERGGGGNTYGVYLDA